MEGGVEMVAIVIIRATKQLELHQRVTHVKDNQELWSKKLLSILMMEISDDEQRYHGKWS